MTSMTLALAIPTLWCLLIFLAAAFALPAYCMDQSLGLLCRLSRGGLLAAAYSIVAVVCLGTIKCYNVFSILLLGLGFMLVTRRVATGLSFASLLSGWPDQVQRTLSGALIWVFRLGREERVHSLMHHPRIYRLTRTLERMPIMSLGFLAMMIGVVILSFCSHIVHWSNLRLAHSDEYLCLLRAREMRLNLESLAKPLLFPALVSATSLLSSTDPLHVVRALSAATPVLAMLGLGRIVFLLTRSLLAASAAMYAANLEMAQQVILPLVSTFIAGQSAFTETLSKTFTPALESQAAMLFVILWMVVLLDSKPARNERLVLCNLACGIILIASGSLLLCLAPFLGIACLSRRPLRSFSCGAIILVLSILAWTYHNPELPVEVLAWMPCALSLLVGIGVFALEIVAVSFVGLIARPMIGAAGVSIAILWFPLLTEAAQPLEYNSVALATSVIAHKFAYQRWSIAAPVEQLAEVYSLGNFQDLAALVDSAEAGDLARAFGSNDSLDDLFVILEKTPFRSFIKEPDSVSFPVLTDSTYRNYRSPAGRASLEMRAMQLCEAYKNKHRNMTIFFEDESIRVYRLHRDSTSLHSP